ncbi:hypothetical protein H6G89_28150 [Oscillatoria sp. FACHB-1407]|uniref:hypothetical protein n=1 Tax=Oscillatoria sp. FACHB-1407 TaxID=2692847 RepID=UPI0019C06018|nr:hypothetical protein [Oscillatoria sp. FACHB-1407]
MTAEVKAQSSSEILLQETGVLETGDASLSSSGILYDEYTFEGSAGIPIRINWSSEEFPANLILLDSGYSILAIIAANGELIQEAGDSAIQNLETRPTATGASAGFSLSQPGMYRVIIAAPDAASDGQYSLSVVTETAP